MPELYLIRHGIAADRKHYANDADRPLTDEGVRKTRNVARRLQSLGLKFDLILTSPLVRARQTADLLQGEKLGTTLQEQTFLSPGGNIQDWLQWLEGWQPQQPESKLALVGHQPDLGNWAEVLVWGEVREVLVVKKAGVIGLTLPGSGSPIGNSLLFWLTAPGLLL